MNTRPSRFLVLVGSAGLLIGVAVLLAVYFVATSIGQVRQDSYDRCVERVQNEKTANAARRAVINEYLDQAVRLEQTQTGDRLAREQARLLRAQAAISQQVLDEYVPSDCAAYVRSGP